MVTSKKINITFNIYEFIHLKLLTKNSVDCILS